MFLYCSSKFEKNATQVDLRVFADQLRTAANFSTDPSKVMLRRSLLLTRQYRIFLAHELELRTGRDIEDIKLR